LLGINYVVVRFLSGHERLDRILGGEADVLVDNGKIKKDRLKKELITIPELEAAAHRQGFASLGELDRVILEPGGTLSFIRKEPPPEEARYAAVMTRLDEISRELARIRSASG